MWRPGNAGKLARVLIELLGILEDGNPHAVGLTADTRTAISFPLGTNLTLRVRVVRPVGDTVKTGVLSFSLKKDPSDNPALVKANLLISGETTDVVITPHDTENLDPGYYVYDVWHTALGGERNPVIPLSPAQLSPSVTPTKPPSVVLQIVKNYPSIPLGLTVDGDFIFPLAFTVNRLVNGVATDVTDQVSWSTGASPPMISILGGGQQVKALVQGTATVTATLGTLSATVQQTIGPPLPATLRIAPRPPVVADDDLNYELSIASPGTQTLQILADMTDGTVVDVTTTCKWEITELNTNPAGTIDIDGHQSQGPIFNATAGLLTAHSATAGGRPIEVVVFFDPPQAFNSIASDLEITVT